MSANQGMYPNGSKPKNLDGLHQAGIEMTRTTGWAIQTNRGRFVNFPHHNLPHFEAYRIITFKTRRQAQEWLDNDRYWKDKAVVVPIVISTREKGET